jgi:hypothetical protein
MSFMDYLIIRKFMLTVLKCSAITLQKPHAGARVQGKTGGEELQGQQCRGKNCSLTLQVGFCSVIALHFNTVSTNFSYDQIIHKTH